MENTGRRAKQKFKIYFLFPKRDLSNESLERSGHCQSTLVPIRDRGHVIYLFIFFFLLISFFFLFYFLRLKHILLLPETGRFSRNSLNIYIQEKFCKNSSEKCSILNCVAMKKSQNLVYYSNQIGFIRIGASVTQLDWFYLWRILKRLARVE